MNDVLTWPVGRADQSQESDIGGAPPLWPVAMYAIFAGVGGAGTALVFGALGHTLEAATSTQVVAMAVGTAMLIGLVLEGRGTVAPLPERRVQVPRHWLRWRRRSLTAGAFGLMIGSGVFTYLEHAVAYTMWGLVLLAPSLTLSALLGACYGLTRGAPVVAAWIADRRGWPRPPWRRLGQRGGSVRAVLVVAGIGSGAGVMLTMY